jgi:hypothetical protein
MIRKRPVASTACREMLDRDTIDTSNSEMTDEPIKGPASYFPSIEKKYGRPIAEWTALVQGCLPAKHMDLVAMLKQDHGMGHGHANAIVAYVLAKEKA